MTMVNRDGGGGVGGDDVYAININTFPKVTFKFYIYAYTSKSYFNKHDINNQTQTQLIIQW